jgi:hypothetical protein
VTILKQNVGEQCIRDGWIPDVTYLDLGFERSNGQDESILSVMNCKISGWWFGTWFLFSIIYGIILPIDELIFFRGVGQPPTRFDLWACNHQ